MDKYDRIEQLADRIHYLLKTHNLYEDRGDGLLVYKFPDGAMFYAAKEECDDCCISATETIMGTFGPHLWKCERHG